MKIARLRLKTSQMKSPYKGRVRDKGVPRPKKSQEQNLPKDAESKGQGDRVQKVLAQLGMGSRRQIEEWIKEGKIKLNGQTAKLGDRLSATDQLVISGRSIDLSKRFNIPTRILIYYKPAGEIVTRRDPEGRPVVFTQLPKLKIGRWITVGRLDINTQGLLLVTNNGELANRLMHPAQSIEREYAVRVMGPVGDRILQCLKNGVELDDGLAKFGEITTGRGEGLNHWYNVTLSEGRNRIVRRLWESQNVMVSRLIRVRYGSIVLPRKLRARTFMELDDKEKAALMASVELQEDRAIRQPSYPRRHNNTTGTTRRKNR